MREGLFRGKRIDNECWVEGFYSNLFEESTNKEESIISFQHFEGADMSYPYPTCNTIHALVDENTVGQFTELSDKKGIKGFYGDICKWGDDLYVISYNNGGFTLKNSFEELPIGVLQTTDNFGDSNINFESKLQYCEIIGNIHDNPELL